MPISIPPPLSLLIIFSIESESASLPRRIVVVCLVSFSRSVHPWVRDRECEPDAPILVLMELHVPMIAASRTGSEAANVPNVRSITVHRNADVYCQQESLLMVIMVCCSRPPNTVVPPTSHMKNRRAFLPLLIFTYHRMMIGARRSTMLCRYAVSVVAGPK